MNLPNTLSLLRIVLAPVFLYLFLSDSPVRISVSFFVFTFAALTDWYDGWYARKYGFKTRWGQFLDPLADKILTSAAFLGFYLLKEKDPAFLGKSMIIPVGILVGIIIARDIILTAVRSIQEIRGAEFKTSWISKTKTFAQMLYIFIVIGFIALRNIFDGTELSKTLSGFLNSDTNYYLLMLITILTLISGAAYLFESGNIRPKDKINI